MSILILIVAGLLADQLAKFWAAGFLTGGWGASELLRQNAGYEGFTMPIINNVLHFTYVENRGAAFGMFQDKLWMFIIINSIAFAAILYVLLVYKPQTKIFRLSLALMAIGAGGNLIDRLFRGFVVDFVDFRIVNFAVFNVADVCVSISAVMLIGCLLFLKSEPILQGDRTEDENEKELIFPDAMKIDKFERFDEEEPINKTKEKS